MNGIQEVSGSIPLISTRKKDAGKPWDCKVPRLFPVFRRGALVCLEKPVPEFDQGKHSEFYSKDVEQAKLLMKYKVDTWGQFYTLAGAIQGEIRACRPGKRTLPPKTVRTPKRNPLSPHSIHQSINPNVQAGVMDMRPDRSGGPRLQPKIRALTPTPEKGKKPPSRLRTRLLQR